MQRTQDHLPIVDVKANGVAILQNGDMAVVLETSAVNFGLLSANEQYAIISAFAGLLNSLSFSIQIVIRSKRLDITDYLKLLDESYKQQLNPLLASMMLRYRSFIESTVRDNEVLDKQFYIVISISYLEVGLSKTMDEASLKKGLTLLLPRRDHIIRQLARIGLKANQLSQVQLIKLFYDIYNFDPKSPLKSQEVAAAPAAVEAVAATDQPETKVETPSSPGPVPNPRPPAVPQPAEQAPIARAAVDPGLNNPQLQNYSGIQSGGAPSGPSGPRRGNPFVVEELRDDYSSV